MPDTDVYEVFALRYGEQTTRTRRESFLYDDRADEPHAIDFFIWVARSRDRVLVIDTGFDPAEAGRRNRTFLHPPREMLATLGIDAETVTDVIITHMHYDHAGSLGTFPTARFHLQTDEMAFATGPCMGHDATNHVFTPAHVCEMVGNVFSGRVAFHDGDAAIAPNLFAHKIGGHTRGLQCVRLLTRRGWVVLASDASHFYENYARRKLFPILVDAQDMLRGFERLEQLADSPDHIVPGHDPLVRAYYPAESAHLDGVIHRLDVAPKTPPR